MRVRALLWFWLHRYSTQVIHGVQVGGQVHIAFGHSHTEIERFFKDTGVTQTGAAWDFEVEPYKGQKRREMQIYENPPATKRAGECRLPAQAPSSEGRYPLWQKEVKILNPYERAKQCICLLRDDKDAFHARVFSIEQIRTEFPEDITEAMLSTRDISRAGVWQDTIVYEDSGVFSEKPYTGATISRKKRKRRRLETKEEFEEGFLREIVVEYAYRNRDLIQQVKERDGFRCIVCGFSFEERYGKIGREFAECHHLLPFSEMKGRRASSIDEAVTVCANCHRMLHRGTDLMDYHELKRQIKPSLRRADKRRKKVTK